MRGVSRAWRIAIWLVGLLFSACLPAPSTPVPQPTATATLTPTTTPTIIWFPATATPTLLPTRPIEPTQDFRPGVGEVILRDDFSDTKQWQTSRTTSGNVAYGNNELTLAVAGDRRSLVSFRGAPQLSNFYLEIDALPSLCSTGDAYGLLMRSGSAGDFYRLLLGCDGRVRMERVKNSQAVLLQDWQESGQLMPGGMIRARIGVWAKGEELRVFVNNTYHFTVRDPVFDTGTIGVFARAGGDRPLTVNFSSLVVNRLDGDLPADEAVPTPTGSR